MTLVGRISRLFDFLLNAGGALASILMVVVMIMVCLKVFVRYVLGYGLVGVDQISGTLLLYIAFLGAGWVLKKEQHITVDIVYAALASGPRRWADVVTSAMCAAVCLVIVVFGTFEVADSWRRGVRVAAEIEMYRAVNLAVIPLGCLLLFFQFVRRALFHLSSSAPGSGE
jgi:TRAP-type C4-dicarboxylate transport system permease small subunit